MQLYSALEIERHDMQRRKEQWAANYRAFDAPVMLLFFMDAVLAAGSYLDYGMFTPIQVAAIAALEGPQECVKEINCVRSPFPTDFHKNGCQKW